MTPTEVLRKYWGYPSFRPGQEEIISAVMQGRDTLALLPTGGGKSICFQIPAVALPGVTLVICPLIALMKDQVRQLKARGIVAEAIHSGLRYQDIDRIFDNAVYGKTKLLYVSPERLRTEMALARIAKMNVSLLAVDEAHCISQWGYDFRPPYLQIADIREALPQVPCIAVTATATPEVVRDIQDHLEFKPGALVLSAKFWEEQPGVRDQTATEQDRTHPEDPARGPGHEHHLRPQPGAHQEDRAQPATRGHLGGLLPRGAGTQRKGPPPGSVDQQRPPRNRGYQRLRDGDR